MDIIHIDDTTDIPEPPQGEGMGLVPRNFVKYPQGYLMCARAFDLPLNNDQEIEEAIKRQETEQSSPEHVFHRNGMTALDQNGQGYCWAYSTTSGIMLGRVIAGLPYVRLSGHHIGCFVKGYRDQGGWNAQSVAFAAENGVASTKFWPEKSMNRGNDTPEMRANAKEHLAIEYMDLDDGDNPSLLKRQLATALVNGLLVATDYNWWSHSVLAARLLAWGPNGASMKTKILNSWGNWSDRGWGELSGGRALPNGAIAIRVSKPSMV